jgi:hypothetical protein
MLHKVIYTHRFIPGIYAGRTIGPIILIRPSHKEDTGLLEHEKVHVRQFWSTLGLFGIPYLLSKKYRLKCELAAYKEQLKYYSTDKRSLFAHYLATKYNLNITQEEALKLLSE